MLLSVPYIPNEHVLFFYSLLNLDKCKKENLIMTKSA